MNRFTLLCEKLNVVSHGLIDIDSDMDWIDLYVMRHGSYINIRNNIWVECRNFLKSSLMEMEDMWKEFRTMELVIEFFKWECEKHRRRAR